MKSGDWTAQHQVTAEVAAACGVSLSEIGRVLGYSRQILARRLKPAQAERQRVIKRRWEEANYGRKREVERLWREANPESRRKKRLAWYQANRERGCETTRLWRESNPERQRELIRRHRSIKRAGRRRASIPLTLETKRERFALWGGGCAYCGAPDAGTVDHVLALNRGGLDTPPNVAPACVPCNSSKCNREVEDWYRRQAFFSEARWQKLQEHCPDML